MKPNVKIASTRTPDGAEMALFRHGTDFAIFVNGYELMHSRRHASELELARLGCAHLAGRRAPVVLVGGLGMGYTLRQTLDLLGPEARVVVAELLAAVIEWNQKYLGPLNDHPLEDRRVEVAGGDIVDLIASARERFDAILLDIDNGPGAISAAGNQRLYGYKGLAACRRALRAQGCLAVWSAEPSKAFEQLLGRCDFAVRRYRVPAYPGSKALAHFVWVASQNEDHLPPGGGAPRPSSPKASASKRRPSRRRWPPRVEPARLPIQAFTKGGDP